jgi:hypothetical protein
VVGSVDADAAVGVVTRICSLPAVVIRSGVIVPIRVLGLMYVVVNDFPPIVAGDVG